MFPDDAPTAGPRPENFFGHGVAPLLKRLFHATRPKFFPASLLPVLAGTAWGVMSSGNFHISVFVLALLATLCVHAGANVLNDVGDDAGGTDRQNSDRIYPYTGGSRFIQAGIMSTGNMARLGISLLAIAAVAGLLLLSLRGVVVLWFGIAGVLLAVLYSLGPIRLSALGLGETAVAVGFGILPVTGAAWLQSGDINAALVIFSLPISAWVAAILLINEVPDIAADGATGKRTLPVRLGHQGTAMLYAGIHVFAAGVVAWLSIAGPLPIGALLVPLVLLVLAFQAASAVRIGVSDRQRMTGAIEATLGIHTVGSLWLCGSVLFTAFWGS